MSDSWRTGLMNEDALADYLDLSARTLQRFRVTGEGPPFVRLGSRRIAYRLADVERWADARAFPHRAAEMAMTPK